MTNRWASSVLLMSAVMSCGRSEVPPDPSNVLRRVCDDPSREFPVREIEIEHTGCGGPCPEYRVRVTSDGQVEYESKKSVREAGRWESKGYPSDVAPLFAWLCEHPALYAESGEHQRGDDTEELVYRFRLSDGGVVVVQSDIGFEHDDLWILSTLVDGVIGRALTVKRGIGG
jgi:uncharacterized protein DUF6438